MTPDEPYRSNLIAHNKAVLELMATYPEDVQAFMRQRFDLSLYPLDFTRKFAESLIAFKKGPQ